MISIIYLVYSCYRLIRRWWCKQQVLPFLPAIFQKKKDVLYAKVPIKVPFHLPASWHFRGSLAFVMVIVWEKNAAKNPPPSPLPPLSTSIFSTRSNIARFVENLCEKKNRTHIVELQVLFKFLTKIASRSVFYLRKMNGKCLKKRVRFFSYSLIVQQIIVCKLRDKMFLNHLLYFKI